MSEFEIQSIELFIENRDLLIENNLLLNNLISSNEFLHFLFLMLFGFFVIIKIWGVFVK